MLLGGEGRSTCGPGALYSLFSGPFLQALTHCSVDETERPRRTRHGPWFPCKDTKCPQAQFQAPLTQAPPGVHASCRVLFAKIMLTQTDVSRIHGSCHATSPENSLPPRPHCHTKYQVSYNSLLRLSPPNVTCHNKAAHTGDFVQSSEALAQKNSNTCKGGQRGEDANVRYQPNKLCFLLLP